MVGGVAFGDMLGVGFQHVLDVGIAVFFCSSLILWLVCSGSCRTSAVSFWVCGATTFRMVSIWGSGA